ncbi:MAG: Error-prone repair protein ImuA [Taibaiella sp.]|nr:Error-prone repair protein ImuA [Taibaiella sp.]
MQPAKHNIIQQLQREILSLQRHKGIPGQRLHTGLGDINKAFPDQTFPLGAVHEFISTNRENAAATNGFMAGLAGQLMQKGKLAVWISTKRTLFPPALNMFGIEPERIVFVDLWKQKEALWTIEEALKCNSLSVVVGELGELSFTESRRLQLVVEQSRVTGFIHRYNPKSENTVACVTRWKITQLASEVNGIPGVGFPKWNVELLKVRNGKPGAWQMEWSAGSFKLITPQLFSIVESFKRKAG